jgi:hypothetical protein
MRASASLHARVKPLVNSTSPKYTPGDAIEIITPTMPFSSISSSVRAMLHCGHGFSPLPRMPTRASALR